MLKISRAIQLFILGASLIFAGLASADPSREDIDQALRAGNILKAETLIKEVVATHPESAKAHFKYAEILAAQGKLDGAKAELSKAEQIQPGLAFAKPESVKSLKHKIAGDAASTSSSPVGFLVIAALLIFVIFMVIRALTNRPQPTYSAVNPAMPNGYGPQGAYPNQPGPVYGTPQSGGMGSSIVGGLATGAAVGAGIVAGEMLMHKVLDGDHNTDSQVTRTPSPTADYSDISGNDFVDNDNGSWDNDAFGDSSSFDNDNSGDWS